jgi:integrase
MCPSIFCSILPRARWISSSREQVGARVVDLNPEGRRQNKKRWAIVPICPTLAAELATWERNGEHVVSHNGRGLTSNQHFDNLQKAAGVSGGAHVIRYTVRTWLAEHGVPDSDADMFMGHKGSGSHRGARYTHRNPEYLNSVKQALEALFAAIAPHLTRPLAGGPGAGSGGAAAAGCYVAT